ncbi:acyl-CoA thioesterase [Aeromicrobium chenweiae]|uniref:4-hydroxybenzoyl-CoA thioesterase n=1 Tax=Aeromicrobium chenweiae TaxID=2079793 RepID=A0A2S0WNA6_9ACTN|nr:thioesterase family protein [Aeromicrobium chenweiae]AWB92828.1 4-hydroxybenzoyl-CoA thioesterase [Aeromicrobium chenweiae]TGN33822.1 acyl-CoA thioesterase [Aeromicrobium chenweiae]
MSEPRLRTDFAVLRTITTRWEDEDVYGHVNNVVYYSYFDTAVNGFLIDATGTDIRRLDAVGLVKETRCEYLRELGFPADVQAGLAVTRLGTSSIVYRIALFQGDDDEPAAIGHFVHVYVDAEARTVTPVPDVIREAVAPLVV